MRDRSPLRHDLAWPRTWPADLPDAARRWLSAGRPAVVCRREVAPGPTAGYKPGPVRLGLALPATPESGEKPGRLAWETERANLLRVRSPLTLPEALPAAPPGWRPALEKLAHDGESLGVEWRVFGSLAWQSLGGGEFAFFNAHRSDLDLLVTPANPAQLDAVLALLLEADRPPLRLDGEILFPGGWAVSWREWSAAPRHVLAKRTDAVALRPPADLRASLADSSRNLPLRHRAPA